jgi:hypothetical protein
VREGIEWEVISVKSDTKLKIKGHSLSAMQISATDILIFGSYFSKQSPCFEKIMFYTFDHEKQTVRDLTEILPCRDDLDGPILVDGSFTDSSVTYKGSIFAFNSYASFNKKFPTQNHHKFKIDDFL